MEGWFAFAIPIVPVVFGGPNGWQLFKTIWTARLWRLGNIKGILGPAGTGGPTRGHAMSRVAAPWAQQPVGRTADAASIAFRVVVSSMVPVPLPLPLSSLARAKNTNALSGRIPPKRALQYRAPTKLQCVAEVLWSPREQILAGQRPRASNASPRSAAPTG